jgi:hypothetical protein
MERLMRAFLSCLVAAAIGCTPKSPEQAFVDSALAVQVAALAADTVDPETGVEVSCLFEKSYAHPDGRALIREFLERDARGDFLQADEWFNTATDCSGHEPGPDTHLMIDGYTVSVHQSGDTLLLGVVTESRIGWVSYDAAMKPVLQLKPETVVDTVVARRTRFGWRVVGPALRQHVEIYGERNFALRNAYKDTLEALGFLRASAE